jgi:hypothetical protein
MDIKGKKLFEVEARDFYLLQSVRIGSGDHLGDEAAGVLS